MRWLGVAVAFATLSVTAVPSGQAASPSAATTPSSRHSYDYDPLGPKTLRVSSPANGGRIASIPHGLDSIRLEAGFGVAAKAGTEAVETTGQIHHVISRKVAKALEENPNLAGKYSARDPRFTTQAVDHAGHHGYQTWHRELDDQVVGWLQRNRGATPKQFEAFLRSRYSRPDLQERFPNGF